MVTTVYEQLIDWREFELFVQKLYQEDQNLKVEHDVTLVGKSGAKRQIDVLITQETKLHKYITLVECKRWKEKIDRTIIDILYASIEDLNASKGVVFTTSGYEAGAEKYAASKNIDIFIVRELNDEEWGLPGKIIHFYMHFYSSKFNDISFPNATLIPLVEEFSTNLDLNIVIQNDQKLDDNLFLFSIKDGARGNHLIKLLSEKQNEFVQKISEGLNSSMEEGKKDSCIVVLSDVEIDFSNYEFRQLRISQGAVNIDKITCKLLTHVSQTVFHFDRGERLNMALVIENYITNQRHIVSESKDQTNLQISENLANKLVKEKVAKGEVLENESIIKVFAEPWVNIELKGNEVMAKTEKLIIAL
ncbi:restriction endonuclease [Paenibacillus sp. UNC499MF]|uniref:restriction endonuclease n=1 Tax=Paenibacillus sp. UNC499MF TaxID=1502751 RepID=UPI0008A07E80|nr:restriction endonuclease [Paenibacillus sp. UNC499MF]SEG75535.1 Restriction endonuclease [Paenibacillus sp. UNC499MF]